METLGSVILLREVVCESSHQTTQCVMVITYLLGYISCTPFIAAHCGIVLSVLDLLHYVFGHHHNGGTLK